MSVHILACQILSCPTYTDLPSATGIGTAEKKKDAVKSQNDPPLNYVQNYVAVPDFGRATCILSQTLSFYAVTRSEAPTA